MQVKKQSNYIYITVSRLNHTGTTTQYIPNNVICSCNIEKVSIRGTWVYFGSEWCLSIKDRLMNTEQSDSSAVLFNSLFFICFWAVSEGHC